MSQHDNDRVFATMDVSVIIPVYNASAYVAEACASALAQAETCEVLLVEDGSSDDSHAVCIKLAKSDGRVRVLQHPGGENRGASASRNLGLRTARCAYIAFLDSDDFYLPGRFSPARRLMEEDKTLDGVYDAVGVTFANPVAETWWRENRQGEALTIIRDRIAPKDLFEALLKCNSGHFCTDGIVFRKHLLERTGFFPEHLSMAEDTCLWLKMACAGRLAGGCLDTPLAMRRVHGQNTIMQHDNHKAYFEYAARREVFHWMPRECRTPVRTQVLLQTVLEHWRWNVLPGMSVWQRPFRYYAMLTGLIRDDLGVLLDRNFRHCVIEATGLPSVRNALRGKPTL